MRMTLRIATLAVTAVAATLGCTAKADQAADKLKDTLQSRLGTNAQIKSVMKSPIPGLYEVNLGAQILYSDAAGDYVLVGDLVDAKTRKNLTAERLAALNKIDFSTLPLDNAIKVVKGDGSRKLAVFSDPNCGYCKKFETTLQSVDNVTVYTFLYPILSEDSHVKAKAIWCAPDRAKSWHGWMVEQRAPQTDKLASAGSDTCGTEVLQKNIALGKSLNVNGTPTIFLSDGRRLPGALPADELNQALSAVR